MSAYRKLQIGWPMVALSMPGIAFGMSPLPFCTIGVFASSLVAD